MQQMCDRTITVTERKKKAKKDWPAEVIKVYLQNEQMHSNADHEQITKSTYETPILKYHRSQ